MANERRKRKFINNWAQMSIAAETVVHALLFTGMIAVILFSPPFVTMFSDYSAEDHQAIARELFLLNYSKWPLFLGLAVFIGFTSVLFSHHISGAAYHLQRVLHQMNDRNLEVKVRLRRWDYLQELQEEINHLLSRLKTDLGSIQQENQKAIELCQNLKDRDSAEVLKKHLAAMDEVLRSYNGVS